MYNIAFCDDNGEYLEVIKERIWSNPEYNPDLMTLYLFQSGREFMQQNLEQFQLVILDMELGEIDGFDIASNIKKQRDNTVIAFCSGVVSPLPEHFDVQPYRYFMKQFDLVKIDNIISELIIEMIRRNISKVEIVSDGRALKIPTDQILYMERQKRGSKLYLEAISQEESERYYQVTSSENLEQWYAQLIDEGFEYVHKSYLVNMKQIVAVVKNTVIFPNGEQLRITKTYKDKFMERFSHYFSKKFWRNRK